jgi:hypothetical protein
VWLDAPLLGRKTSSTVAGLDAAVVAIIPFCPSLRSSPALGTAYATYPSRRTRAALKLLFASGNQTPPGRINGPSGLTTFVEAKDFRGALGIADVVLNLDCGGDIVGLSFQYQGRVGYTPLDLGVFVPSLRRYGMPLPGWAPPRVGTGGVQQFDATLTPKFCIVRLQCNFKIGPFLDMAQFMLTRHRAPSAWVCMDYLIRPDGQVGVRFWASDLPTVYHYIRWNRVRCAHDMMANERVNIDRFITAGACRIAPGELRCEWPSNFRWSSDEARALQSLGRPGRVI